MRLYEEIELIENAINDILYADGDVDIDALNNLMAAKAETIERGMETLCKIRARKVADIETLRDEAKRLVEKADREIKSLERLEQYMMDMLARSGQPKLTAGTFTVGTRNSTSVYVDPAFNNPEYMRTTTTSAPDKVKIKDAIQAGAVIDGAHLVNKTNLAVK